MVKRIADPGKTEDCPAMACSGFELDQRLPCNLKINEYLQTRTFSSNLIPPQSFPASVGPKFAVSRP